MKSAAVVVCIVCAAVSLMAAGVVVGVAWSQTKDETDLDREVKQAQLDAYRLGMKVFDAAVRDEWQKTDDEARHSSAVTNLKTIRAQLQLYKAQHEEQWPTDFESQMLQYTNARGECSKTQTPEYRFGPYLLRIPANPYTGASEVIIEPKGTTSYQAAEDMERGWWYNSETGEFRCHVPDAEIDTDGVAANKM
jgi:general secretion pathway protein G